MTFCRADVSLDRTENDACWFSVAFGAGGGVYMVDTSWLHWVGMGFYDACSALLRFFDATL